MLSPNNLLTAGWILLFALQHPWPLHLTPPLPSPEGARKSLAQTDVYPIRSPCGIMAPAPESISGAGSDTAELETPGLMG